MKKGLIILIFLVIIIYAASSMAYDKPCRCLALCQQTEYCYFGDCSNSDLNDTECQYDNGSYAGRCDFCSICIPPSNCVIDNKFNYSNPDCKDYYSYVTNTSLQPEYCYQTVNYNIFQRNDAGNDVGLDGASISIVNSVDRIDYSDVFRTLHTNLDSTGNFIMPRCRGEEIVDYVATKEMYDSDAAEVTLETDNVSDEKEINFTLLPGQCNSDCTNAFGRCDPNCQGFSNGTDSCDFYETNVSIYNKNVTELCAYKLKETQVILNTSDEGYTIFTCCEGGIDNVTRVVSNITLGEDKDLIVDERPVRFGEDPGKLKIYYWE